MAVQASTIPRAVLLACLIALAPAVAAAVKESGAVDELKPGTYMYRYTTDSGEKKTASIIPPQFAKNGYEIVSLKGTVLKTVAPEPTAEERAELAKNAEHKVTEEQQRELDKQLLLRYSSVADIEGEKKRKLAEIDAKAKMLEVNESATEQQIAAEQRKAAQAERNGQQVPPAVVTALNNLQQELKVLGNQRQTRAQEMIDEAQRFDQEIERFKTLEKYRR